MIDRKIFFDCVRKNPFDGSLTQGQVIGMEAILAEWERRSSFTDPRWLAYMLATVFHETARKMTPIHEYGSKAYFDKRYGPRTSVGKMLGNTQPGDVSRFHGRGYVQLTGRRNYIKAGQELGTDLVTNPDRALEPTLAAAIMFLGMSEGWFTGKKLSDYISGSKADFTNARRIINGTDKATTIKGYALAFLDALDDAWIDAPLEPVRPMPKPEPIPAPPSPPDDPMPVPEPEPIPASAGFWARLLAALRALFG